ncbi:hypothetical protein Ac2012v2_007425 [Leucoagaricus gongylophorus]
MIMASGLLSPFMQIYAIFVMVAVVLADEQVILSGNTRIEGHTTGILRRFVVTNEQQRDQILQLATEINLDIWQLSGSHIDIYAPAQSDPLPSELMNISHVSSTIGAQPVAYSTVNANWNLPSFANSTYHGNYHPLYEIDEFIQEVAELNPNLVQLHRIGHSAEGREMIAITLSAPSTNPTKRGLPGPGKLGFVIVGAQHAREWIATATAIYLVHALVADPSEPRSLRRLLDSFDFHIIPTPNPDGYVYTWEVDRYWYKNRQILGPRLKCTGLDMNRNWGYKWKSTVEHAPKMTGPSVMHHKSAADPCSHWFPGHRAFESPEVNNIANFVTTLPNVVGFLDLRSYGQMISSPFSYSCERLPKDAEDLIEAATGAANALKSVYGTLFDVDRLCYLLYPAPGNILDWMYKVVGIRYSYVAHLRDTGTYGFSLPESWIRPVGEETAKMVEYISDFISSRIKRKT